MQSEVLRFKLRLDWKLEITEECKTSLVSTKLSFSNFVVVQCIKNIKFHICPNLRTKIIFIFEL